MWKADRTFLVPGHGNVYDKLDLLEYRDAVTIVRDRVQDLVNEGKTLAQVKAANPTLGYRSQYGADSGPWTTDMFVEVIYNELAAKKGEEVKKGKKPRVLLLIAPVLATGILLGAPVAAQRGNQPPPPPAPRAGAPIDLTGYWVSIVTADWRWRMVTPAKGDYQGVQLNAEGRKVADAWDPAKDEAAGEQCKSYGAPALMSVPGRIHITWQDDTTLKVDADAGTQTRLLRFSSTPRPEQGRGATGSGQAPRQAQRRRRRRRTSRAPGRASRRRGGCRRVRPCRCSCGPPIARRTRRRFARPADRCKSSRRICVPGTCGRTAFPTARTPC